MNAIAAVSLDWGIGRDNGLLFHIPEDMKRFRALTRGGTVLMGRRTLDSLPGGRPLPNRRSVILTRSASFARPGVEAAHSLEEALALTRGQNVWVIGGGQLYEALLPRCEMCWLTRVYARPACDVFFPNLDRMEKWKLFHEGALLREGELAYQFVEYIQR